MVMQRNVFRIVMVVSLLTAGAAQAQSFRCDAGLASVGESKAGVLQKCGEPALQSSYCQAAEPATRAAPDKAQLTVNVLPCVTVDEWTYNPGKGKFLTTLRFENGELSSISQGERVRD